MAVEYSLTDYGTKEGQPTKFKAYSMEELRHMLVDNAGIASTFAKDKRFFLVIKVRDLTKVKILFAALIREVFKEKTKLVTYLPSRQLMYIYYGPEVNWIDDIKNKCLAVVWRVLAMDMLERPKDKWGQNLTTGHIEGRNY
jgi:hypothetical protein